MSKENPLPNPYNLNEEELEECKKVTGYISSYVCGRSYAKAETIATWVLTMLMEMSLDDGAAKSKSDLLLASNKIFNELNRYIKAI